MMGIPSLENRPVTAPSEWPRLVPLIGLILVVLGSVFLAPETVLLVLIASLGMALVALRPHWGVAIILTTLMVQYGTRVYEREGYERSGWAYVARLVPAGEGLVTVNNVLGLFLALLLVYQIYRDQDWSFLRSRQVQIVLLVTGVLVLSGFVNGVDYQEQAALGLRLAGQDPMRLLVSRAMFLLLFVFFVRQPRDLRLIIALFVALVLSTAWSGSTAAISRTVDIPQAAEYRAGGVSALIETAGNPNRLAMISTFALVFIWEYGQSHGKRAWRWLTTAAVLFLVVSVFLTASRGGVIGLSVAGLMLLVRGRTGVGRLLYGVLVVLLAGAVIRQVVPTANIERLRTVPGISEDAEGEGAGSVERRQYTYGVGLEIWSSAPLLGIGLGNWSYTRFTTDPLHSVSVPHNSYLKVLAEGGMLSLALYLLLFYLTIRQLVVLERDPEVNELTREEGMDWLISATRVCLIAFLVFSIFADLWDLIFFYLLIGTAAVLIKRYERARYQVVSA